MQGHELTITQVNIPSFFGNDFGSSFTYRGSIVLLVLLWNGYSDSVEWIGFSDGFS